MAERRYSEILQPMDSTQRGYQALFHQGKPKIEDECADNHDRDVAYYYWTGHENTKCSYSEHNACDTTVPTTSYEEHGIRVDKIVLYWSEHDDQSQTT